jgi:hypothetical protein
MDWQHKILSGLPRTRQERSNPTPTQLLFTFEILLLFLPQPSTREERSNATLTILLLQIFFCLLFGFACGSKWASVSNRSAAAVCLRLQDLLLLRACVSKVCCAAARLHLQGLLRWFVSLALLLLLFLRSYPCSKSAVDSCLSPNFFSHREDHGEAYDLPVFQDMGRRLERAAVREI